MIDSFIIELDCIDSTNNYAMQLIDADKAQHGLTIVAGRQTEGKGQRGRSWIDSPGESLLMSVVVQPKEPISAQFLFNAGVTVAIAKVLAKLNYKWQLKIKWPNDIIINDKKAGGILIENVLRGSKWTHAVIGLGLNVNQATFSDTLPFATSLAANSDEKYDLQDLRYLIRNEILKATNNAPTAGEIMKQYNQLLYRSGDKQSFTDGKLTWSTNLINVEPNGALVVQLENGAITKYNHGQVQWVWE